MSYSSGKNPRRRGRPPAPERSNVNASLGPHEVLSDIVVNPNVDSQKYVYSSHQGDMLSDTTCFEHSQWIPDIGRNESSLNDSHYNAFDNMTPRCDSHDNTSDNMVHGIDSAFDNMAHRSCSHDNTSDNMAHGIDNTFDNMAHGSCSCDNTFDNMAHGIDNTFDSMAHYGSDSMGTADLAWHNSSPSSL